MRTGRASTTAGRLLGVAVALAALLVFAIPGLERTHGDWPVPLDDTFIHFDFARALAHGHPLEWIAGQGYSSGETAPVYALVLGVGYALGFHGMAMGVFAALVALLSLAVALDALARLLEPAPSWVIVLGGLLLFASGTLDLSFFSGMEVAFFSACAARMLLAVRRAREASASGRPSAQWRAGGWLLALAWIRPEAIILTPLVAVVVARRAGSGSPVAALARVALPPACATGSILLLNRLFSGDWASAGARLKLLSSNPFSIDVSRATDYFVALGSLLWNERRELSLGPIRWVWLSLPLLALCSLFDRKRRALGVVALGGGVLYALLAAWNGAARFQFFRDFMPAVALVLFASALGLASLARGPLRIPAGVVAALGLGGGLSHVPEAARLFARASANIHEQQVEIGRRLARTTRDDAIILVGDAGAIPYVSGRHAVDAFGLGSYHGLPFVRAAVEGEGATLELIERLPAELRPTVLALYPAWFPGITGTYGRERDSVTLADNVICGAPTKGIYDVTWSGMDGVDEKDAVDELDVADVVSEREHGYVSPAPDGGWVQFHLRKGPRGQVSFDAGRVIPAGQSERFHVTRGTSGPGSWLLRTDESSFAATLWVDHPGGGGTPARFAPAREGGTEGWSLWRADPGVRIEVGDTIAIRVTLGELHDFHGWLVPGL